VAAKVVKDPEIRKLSPGSEEFNAAVVRIQKDGPAEKSEEAPASDSKKETSKNKENSTEDKDEGETKKSSKSGLERRFSEITGERDEARRKAADLEDRLAKLEAAQGTKKESSSEPSFTPQEFQKDKPGIEKFETYADYQEALVDWKLEKKEFELEQKKVVAQAQEKQKEVISTWDAKEKVTKDRVEGYDQLIDESFMNKFTKAVASKESLAYLLESDFGPDLLFELAEDEAKMEGFKSMSGVKQVAYLTRLERKFEKEDTGNSQEKSTTGNSVSKAPPPSKNLPKGKANVAKDISHGVSDFGTYLECANRIARNNNFLTLSRRMKSWLLPQIHS
jgi:hypothetical protein